MISAGSGKKTLPRYQLADGTGFRTDSRLKNKGLNAIPIRKRYYRKNLEMG